MKANADEKKEAMIDEAMIAELEIDPYKKVSTSLLLVMHRQLITLSAHTSVAIEDMDRAFIIEHLANVKVTDRARAIADYMVNKVDEK